MRPNSRHDDNPASKIVTLNSPGKTGAATCPTLQWPPWFNACVTYPIITNGTGTGQSYGCPSVREANPRRTGHVNSLRPGYACRHYADDTFKRTFLSENVRISIKTSLKCALKGSANKYSSIGLDNRLVPSRWQAIIRTNDGWITDAHVVRSQWVHINIMGSKHSSMIFFFIHSFDLHQCVFSWLVILEQIESYIWVSKREPKNRRSWLLATHWSVTMTTPWAAGDRINKVLQLCHMIAAYVSIYRQFGCLFKILFTFKNIFTFKKT